MRMGATYELAEQFAAALTGADMAALDACLSSDFTIWYNFSDAMLTRDQAIAFFGEYFAAVSVRFRDIRRLPTPDGWVQQHRVDADGPEGFEIRGMPACLVFTVSDGRIAHIAEYFDSAQTPGFDRSRMLAD